MKKHHSVQEILRFLGEAEKNGKPVQQVCRENIQPQTSSPNP